MDKLQQDYKTTFTSFEQPFHTNHEASFYAGCWQESWLSAKSVVLIEITIITNNQQYNKPELTLALRARSDPSVSATLSKH